MYPQPSAERNFRPMIELDQLTPATPWPLLAAPAMVPATWVPWLLSSMGSPSLLRKS